MPNKGADERLLYKNRFGFRIRVALLPSSLFTLCFFPCPFSVFFFSPYYSVFTLLVSGISLSTPSSFFLSQCLLSRYPRLLYLPISGNFLTHFLSLQICLSSLHLFSCLLSSFPCFPSPYCRVFSLSLIIFFPLPSSHLSLSLSIPVTSLWVSLFSNSIRGSCSNPGRSWEFEQCFFLCYNALPSRRVDAIQSFYLCFSKFGFVQYYYKFINYQELIYIYHVFLSLAYGPQLVYNTCSH